MAVSQHGIDLEDARDDAPVPVRRPRRWRAVRSALDWIAASAGAERDRWGLWLPVGFGAGIAGYFALAQEPPAWIGGAGVLAAGGLAVLGRRHTGLLLIGLATLAMAAGFATVQLRTAHVAAPVLEQTLNSARISGRVVEVEPRPPGRRVLLDRVSIDGLDPAQTPARIRVTLRGTEPPIRPGGWLTLRASLRPPPEPAAPGAYDFARQAYFQRLGAVGFARGPASIAEPPQPDSAWSDEAMWEDWLLWWAGLRQSVSARILGALPGRTGKVATALMTGERGSIPEADLTAMRDSGLAHLLAISGLHVGLVAGLLYFSLRAMLALVPWVALRYPIRKWAAAGAALGAFAYLMLTGATVPTQRAVLMISLALLAVVLDRTAFSPRMVAWAAIAVLAVTPEVLLSASFQMSFAAVFALIAGFEALRDRGVRTVGQRGPAARAGLYVGGVALTSLIAGLATAPFAVYHFNRIAWYGLAANLVAVPLTAMWIMPWAVVAFILMPFGAERLALAPMGWGIEAMLTVAQGVAAWPGSISLVAAMPTGGLALLTLGGFWLCLWRRPWRLAGIVPLVVGALTVAGNPPPDLLASGDGRLFAVLTPEGEMLLSSGRVRRFDAEVWARQAGEADPETWPRSGAAADGRLTCDPLGCIYRARDHVVALVQDGRALAEDCAAATVVISREPIRGRTCVGTPLVIDRFDLWREGGHAVWLSPAGVRVQSVADWRGQRPWVARRGREGE
ncbi:MAG TPA: ComEC/Rec2 family competence protein [Kiloniellales bacterium]